MNKARQSIVTSLRSGGTGKTFSDEVKLLLIDKGILGVALLIISSVFQYCWHSTTLNVNKQIHASEMELERTKFASAQLAVIGDPTVDVNIRTFLLSTLVQAKAIDPSLVATNGQLLLENNASEAHFVHAIRQSMLIDVAPFLEVSELVVRSVRLKKVIRNPLVNAEDLLSKWRTAFQIYLELDESDHPAISQLNDQSFIVGSDYGVFETGRLHTLAYLIGPNGRNDFQRAIDLSQSEVKSLEIIGHLAVTVLSSRNLSYAGNERSYEFIVERIRTPPATDEGIRLLSEELRILKDSEKVFGTNLVGDIAIPIAELFVVSESDLLRQRALDVLIEMGDGGVKSDRLLSQYIDDITVELASIGNRMQRRFRVLGRRNEIASIAELAHSREVRLRIA